MSQGFEFTDITSKNSKCYKYFNGIIAIIKKTIMSDISYDKIKCLVEVDDDILAAFTVLSGKEDYIDNLSVAENTNITKEFIDNVHLCLQDILRNLGTTSGINSIFGRLKWKVYEYDQVRILLIFEKDRVVTVLIKSDTSLHETIDNILGYYFEAEGIPKSLF